MGIDIDWGLLRQETPLSTYLTQDQQAADAAQQRQQSAAVRSALAGYDPSNPQGTIGALTKAGAFQQASALSSLNASQREQDADLAGGKALAAAYQPDGTVDPTKLLAAGGTLAGQVGLKAAVPLFQQAAEARTQGQALDLQRRKAVAQVAANAMTLGDGVEQKDGESQAAYAARLADTNAKRGDFIRGQQAWLVKQGVTPDRITAELKGPLDDEHLGLFANAGDDADAIQKNQQSALDSARKDKALAETARHNRADEGLGQQNATAHMISAKKGPISINLGDLAPPVVGTDNGGAPAGSTPTGNADH